MGFSNENRGVLFKNKNKKSDKHPDYTGKQNVEGVEYFLSGWVKTSNKDGTKFFSLALTPVSKVQSSDLPQSQPVQDDQDLPF